MSNDINVEFLKPFVTGTLETLKIQCELDATYGKPFLKDQKNQLFDYDVEIAGIVGVTSPEFTGSICICFPKETFLAIMGQMFDESYPEITDELEDGAGELLNIIYGFAKRILNDQGYHLEKALPSIIRGNLIKVKSYNHQPTLVLPFESSAGKFHLEITVGKQ